MGRQGCDGRNEKVEMGMEEWEGRDGKAGMGRQ